MANTIMISARRSSDRSVLEISHEVFSKVRINNELVINENTRSGTAP
jgi:hypothetical protein